MGLSPSTDLPNPQGHFSALLSLSAHSHPHGYLSLEWTPSQFPSRLPASSSFCCSPYLLGVEFLKASLLPSRSCFVSSPTFWLSSPPPFQPCPHSSVFISHLYAADPTPPPQPTACAQLTLPGTRAPLRHLRPHMHSSHRPPHCGSWCHRPLVSSWPACPAGDWLHTHPSEGPVIPAQKCASQSWADSPLWLSQPLSPVGCPGTRSDRGL